MDFEANFGIILAMAGFRPTAEFWQGTVQVQVSGTYCHLPGGVDGCEDSGDDPGGEPENQAPTAVLEVVQCASLTCQFEGISSVAADGTIVAYSWNFGDGTTSTASGRFFRLIKLANNL
jgi:hypothetical protein